MTLEQLAAQLLWCGWGPVPGSESELGRERGRTGYDDHARWLVEELGVGGLALFDRNLGAPEEIAALVEQLRRAAPRPLLLGIDQEGGRVCRLPLPGLTFPGAMALGALDDPATTHAVYRAIGEQLAALGIDVDYAPVLDVNNNPQNPIIGVRSFGEEPERVVRHGLAAAAGLRAAGVLPVVKHFPGHGDTAVDSHLDLPVQPADRARLDRVELLPFRAAIEAARRNGEPLAVMTTHILFPALDPDLPATLSRRILTGLLREELGFDGLVVTDCLEMQGIAARWSPEEAAVLALQAGADMLLVSHTRETQARMHRAVCEAVRAGHLPETRLVQSLERIERVRAWTASVRNAPRRPERVGAPEYRELEARTAERCLYLWDERQLAAQVPVSRPMFPFTVSGAAGPAQAFAAALRDLGERALYVPDDPAHRTRLAQAEALVWVAAPNDPFPGGRPDDALFHLLDEAPRVLVIAVGEPYLLNHYPESVLKLAAWGARPLHLSAAARWLAGRVRPA